MVVSISVFRQILYSVPGCMYGLHDFVSCMLEAGADPSLTSEDCGSAPVLQAAYHGHNKVLKVLIEHKQVSLRWFIKYTLN